MGEVITMPKRKTSISEAYKANERYRKLQSHIQSLMLIRDTMTTKEALMAIDNAIDAVVRDYIDLCRKEKLPPIIPV